MENNLKDDRREPNNGRGIWVGPYTVKQLSKLYGIHRSTFYRWIEPHKEAIGKKYGHYYTTWQVRTIFEKLDLP